MHRTSVEWLHSLEKGTERDELVTDATPQGRGPAVAGSLRRVRPGHSGSGRTAGRRPQGQTRSPRKGLEKRVPTDDRWNDRLDIRGRFRSWFGLHDGQGHRARQGDERTRRRPTLRPQDRTARPTVGPSGTATVRPKDTTSGLPPPRWTAPAPRIPIPEAAPSRAAARTKVPPRDRIPRGPKATARHHAPRMEGPLVVQRPHARTPVRGAPAPLVPRPRLP